MREGEPGVSDEYQTSVGVCVIFSFSLSVGGVSDKGVGERDR